ncbi:hypothetical protein F2P56_011598, partial [Juglans regia]
MNFGLLLQRGSSFQLYVYLDVDWAGCHDDRKSTSDYRVYLGPNLISWSSKKQPTVGRSSTEVEYRFIAHATVEVIWLQSFLQELGIFLAHNPILYSDNIGATYLTSNPVFHACTKHVEIDYHFVREKVHQRVLDDQCSRLFPPHMVSLPNIAACYHTLCSLQSYISSFAFSPFKEQNMAELVGGALLSAFLQVLFDRMASREFTDFLRGRKPSEELLYKLTNVLLFVGAVLEDAEDKQVTNSSVKTWHNDLKDAVYDAEDVLDKIATKALQSKLDAEFGTNIESKVRNSIHTSPFFKKIEERIKGVLGRLENLASQQNVIGLVQASTIRRKASERLPTTSLVEDSKICGRNDDKDEIINNLLPGNASDNEIGVIAIIGMGGMGKTTLAQLVYNDKTVQKHFHPVAWVCVSEDFDMFKVTKTILEAVTSSTSDIKDLNRLQLQLKEKLMGKKFLIILDDVWNRNCTDWEILSNPFKSGAKGSRIIVTTRDVDVALAMRAFETHHLKELQEEDCWSLFARHAFHDANSSNMNSDFEALGRKIVEKCKGLPLAIKTIGALLRSKVDVSEWDKVLNSEIWSLSNQEIQILPALRLSYKHLPSFIKRCFAYCSLFPKDYAFKKD